VTADELVDAVKARMVVELGLDNVGDYAVRSVVMLTTEVLEENGVIAPGDGPMPGER
jgi:hypothetical protein